MEIESHRNMNLKKADIFEIFREIIILIFYRRVLIKQAITSSFCYAVAVALCELQKNALSIDTNIALAVAITKFQ